MFYRGAAVGQGKQAGMVDSFAGYEKLPYYPEAYDFELFQRMFPIVATGSQFMRSNLFRALSLAHKNFRHMTQPEQWDWADENLLLHDNAADLMTKPLVRTTHERHTAEILNDI